MKWLRLLFWYMWFSSLSSAAVFIWWGCGGSKLWFVLAVGQIFVTYALTEIIHTLYKPLKPPHPTSLAFQKFAKRYKI